MGRYGKIDYPTVTKRGFLFGLSMLIIGGLGTLVGHSLFQTLPQWETTVFFYMEVVGLLIAFFTPFIFGILLPLTE